MTVQFGSVIPFPETATTHLAQRWADKASQMGTHFSVVTAGENRLFLVSNEDNDDTFVKAGKQLLEDPHTSTAGDSLINWILFEHLMRRAGLQIEHNDTLFPPKVEIVPKPNNER